MNCVLVYISFHQVAKLKIFSLVKDTALARIPALLQEKSPCRHIKQEKLHLSLTANMPHGGTWVGQNLWVCVFSKEKNYSPVISW